MMRGSRVLGAAILLLAIGAGGLFAARALIGAALFERVTRNTMARDVMAGLPDGLHLALCGTGSPMPDRTRAGPCAAVIAGNRLFLVDAGEGGIKNVMLMGLPPGRIEAVFITHFHSDHIAGLGEVALQRWVGGAHRTPLPVIGPIGVSRVVDGFNAAYALDGAYRVAHHGAATVPPGGAGSVAQPFTIPLGGLGRTADHVLLKEGGLTVTAFRVNHSPVEPAVGYRFDYKGRSLVISGDTAASPSVTVQAMGADLLVHEALQPRLVNYIGAAAAEHGNAGLAKIAADILTYHTTPEQAAQIATEAKVRHLVLTHVVPPLPLRLLYPAFLGEAPGLFPGAIAVGEDGMLFSLPADSQALLLDRLL